MTKPKDLLLGLYDKQVIKCSFEWITPDDRDSYLK